jgi:hypothetical protein
MGLIKRKSGSGGEKVVKRRGTSERMSPRRDLEGNDNWTRRQEEERAGHEKQQITKRVMMVRKRKEERKKERERGRRTATTALEPSLAWPGLLEVKSLEYFVLYGWWVLTS